MSPKDLSFFLSFLSFSLSCLCIDINLGFVSSVCFRGTESEGDRSYCICFQEETERLQPPRALLSLLTYSPPMVSEGHCPQASDRPLRTLESLKDPRLLFWEAHWNRFNSFSAATSCSLQTASERLVQGHPQDNNRNRTSNPYSRFGTHTFLLICGE